jgi:hypothetical protein
LRLVSSRSARAATDGSLALALPLPLTQRPALHLVPALPRTDARTGRDITPEFLPAPGPRASQLARAVLEVLAGDRPARHLAKVTATDVQDQLEDCAGPRASRPWARSLRSVRLSQPGPGVAEVTAVVERGSRCSALAFRMEGLDGRWIVTELALP